MSRVQVLVQFDDELLSLLDERAAAAGVSCSEMVRRGVRAVLASDGRAKLDQAIAAGYKRVPPPVPDAPVERLGGRLDRTRTVVARGEVWWADSPSAKRRPTSS